MFQSVAVTILVHVGRTTVGDAILSTRRIFKMELYTRLMTWIADFKSDEEGVTAIEYGLLAALIAVVMAAGATVLGTNLDTLFDNIAADILP